LFESPHRIVASLADAAGELGDRPAALARELTKMNEEVVRGTLTEIHRNLAARDRILGEFVLVIGGGTGEPKDGDGDGDDAEPGAAT
nr:16S rRNA (cytidine(1402)-2'-O)-methyltransferase [Thermoanaerobaculia bacterium]